jgi:hypothetical protein
MSSERRGGKRDEDTHQGSTSTGIAGGSPEHGRGTDRRRGGEVVGEGWRSPETERERQRTERSGCRPRAREGKVFLKKPDMGAPDSLQCLSGAHRTAHSNCPVNHRTAHRRIKI